MLSKSLSDSLPLGKKIFLFKNVATPTSWRCHLTPALGWLTALVPAYVCMYELIFSIVFSLKKDKSRKGENKGWHRLLLQLQLK